MRSIEELSAFIDEVAELIADAKGHNVPYCESMDVSLLPIVVDIADEDRETSDILDAYNASEDDILGELQFLACNGRVLPKDLAKAGFEEFRTYVKANRGDVLAEIEKIFQNYYDCYSDEA